MQKSRYELDPYNRFVIDGSGTKSSLLKFRKVLDGQFRIGANNNLSYHIKAPLSEDERIPHHLKLRGAWSLDDDHDLRLTMDKQGRQTFGDQITLQGEILDVDQNSLLFAVTTKTKEGTRSTYVLNLEGSWRADENNRLTFRIKRERGEYDILTFNGAWEINKHHQIIYEYEKGDLIRKKKRLHTLTFKGYWDIEDRFRITYAAMGNSESRFDFRTSACLVKKDYIEYELGIDLSNRAKPVKRTIALFGAWKIKRDTGLLFEIEYENGRVHAITFGAEARLTDKDTVSFRLKKCADDKDTGMTLELSHRLLKGDGTAFLRALKSKDESAIYAGMACRW